MPRDVGLCSGIRVKFGLQTQNFGAAGCSSFVRLAQFGGEGLDLVLARCKLCSLGGELLGCGVGECVVFVLEIGVVFLEGIQGRAQGAEILVYFDLAATSPECRYRK